MKTAIKSVDFYEATDKKVGSFLRPTVYNY